MGARRIAGITVEIGGDTTKLTTALKDVDKALSTTQSSLRDVNKLLKLDPGNTELLTQKHRLLGEAVSETRGEAGHAENRCGAGESGPRQRGDHPIAV